MTFGLRTWSFFLSLKQSQKRHVGNLNHLETNSWNVTYSMALPTKSRNQNLVVLFNIIQTSVVRNKSCDLLPVLDELHTNAFTNGRVRLFGFNAHLLQYDSFRVRSSTKRIGFQRCTEMCFLVAKVVPSLFTTKGTELTSDSNSTWLT